MPRNEHIASLGYRLSKGTDRSVVEPLLAASGLTPLDSPKSDDWEASEYLVAGTTAGGIAATIGWNRSPKTVVLHSLAVAPSSRGSGIGASMLAEGMSEIIDEAPVDEMYLTTGGAKNFFAAFGFEAVEDDETPEEVVRHPAFESAAGSATPMVRRYHRAGRGLDKRAFRLIHNTTTNATIPPGSVFLFKQSGSIIESHYRGGPVQRGHIIGSIKGNELSFLWHQAVDNGDLMQGDGRIFVDDLEDGRRELRERIGDASDPGELLLREV